MKKFACYRFINCIHTRANEPPLPIRKETRASSEAMKQKKKGLFVETSWWSSWARLSLQNYNHPNLGLKKESVWRSLKIQSSKGKFTWRFRTLRVSVRSFVWKLVLITRYSCSGRIFVFPFLFVQARETRANGEVNKKAIESFSSTPAHHFGLANTSLVWLDEGKGCYASILSIKSFRFHKLV